MGVKSILTVVTAAVSTDLTTLTTVKSDLSITGSSEDTKLARWITEASEVITSQCNRLQFGKEELSETIRSDAAFDEIVLQRRPVSTADDIMVTENDSELAAEDYEIDPRKGILRRLTADAVSTWPAGKIVVEYFAGYALLDGLPRPIEKATIKLVGHYRSNATRDPFVKGEAIDIPGVRSVRTDFWVGSIGEGDALPPEVADLIEPYRDFATA